GGSCGDSQGGPAPTAVAITRATTGWSTTHLPALDHRRCTPATGGGGSLLGSAGRRRAAGGHPLFADATHRRVLCLLQIAAALTNGVRISPPDTRQILDPAMPQLGRFDRRIPTSIFFRQPSAEPLHLLFDLCCIPIHAALLDPESTPWSGYYGSSNPGSYS